jgi:predicted TIM-barrel fold metal-dependent hydrolase
MVDVVARAAATLNSPEKLKQIILVNYVEGEGPKDKGYRHIPEAKLTVQFQAANAAWKATIHIIKALHMNIDVVFMWENKDNAAYPGTIGQMKYEAA